MKWLALGAACLFLCNCQTINLNCVAGDTNKITSKDNDTPTTKVDTTAKLQ